jgi:GNAT superfamily N-acetyltransferase
MTLAALIRPLVPDDFEAYCALLQDLVGAEKVLSGPRGAAVFAQMLAEPETVILGAEVTGCIASVATLHLHHNLTYLGRPYAVIENVVTRASHRGRGLGQAVIKAAIERVWAADGYKIMLQTGRGYGAKGFYEKLGFTDSDKHAMTLRREPPRA